MSTYITSLPVRDNNRQSTARQRAAFFARLTLHRVRFTTTTGCYGIWFDDNGRRYAEETVLVTMFGDEAAMRSACAAYGEEARQLAVLFVSFKANNGHIVGWGYGHEGADQLAHDHGGATLLPNGNAYSFDYAALEAGVDYAAVNV